MPVVEDRGEVGDPLEAPGVPGVPPPREGAGWPLLVAGMPGAVGLTAGAGVLGRG